MQFGHEPSAMVVSELAALSRRCAAHRSRNHAVHQSTTLFICTVIGVLFLSAFLKFDTSTAVAILFITAMLAFFLGLLTFLREIFLAMATVRVGLEQVPILQPS